MLAAVLLVLVSASVAGLLPVETVRVESDSMEPTIAAGDLLLVLRGAGEVHHRDVVAVPHPGTGDLLVKRAVALGGDRVAVEDGVLVVNGSPVCEPAIDPDRQDGVWFGPVTVPRGAVFLLGDNRDGAIDSRDFGAVETSSVVGEVVGRAWPSPGRLPAETC